MASHTTDSHKAEIGNALSIIKSLGRFFLSLLIPFLLFLFTLISVIPACVKLSLFAMSHMNPQYRFQASTDFERLISSPSLAIATTLACLGCLSAAYLCRGLFRKRSE